MMVAVAVVAFVLGAEGVRRQWVYCRGRAAYHGGQETMLGGDAEVALALVGQADVGPAATRERDMSRWQSEAGRYAALAAYHAWLRAKYERAARYPWLPVPPDPE
jgi:hypothetical protein